MRPARLRHQPHRLACLPRLRHQPHRLACPAWLRHQPHRCSGRRQSQRRPDPTAGRRLRLLCRQRQRCPGTSSWSAGPWWCLADMQRPAPGQAPAPAHRSWCKWSRVPPRAHRHSLGTVTCSGTMTCFGTVTDDCCGTTTSLGTVTASWVQTAFGTVIVTCSGTITVFGTITCSGTLVVV